MAYNSEIPLVLLDNSESSVLSRGFLKPNLSTTCVLEWAWSFQDFSCFAQGAKYLAHKVLPREVNTRDQHLCTTYQHQPSLRTRPVLHMQGAGSETQHLTVHIQKTPSEKCFNPDGITGSPWLLGHLRETGAVSNL